MERAALSGVAVVDKPRGLTSHTMVAQARRMLGRRDLGHAGTLDPMATGVLLILVGQACKLSSYLTLDSKRYAAEVSFGRSTDTLDADGVTVYEQPLEPGQPTRKDVEAALDAERARRQQVPPVVSAIKVDGHRSYALARRGEAPELAPRPVVVHELELQELAPPLLRCELLVSKGYYVRSLARDLGERLGVPAHLSALRRLASGPFRIEQAQPWPLGAATQLIELAEVARTVLPVCQLRAEAVTRARQGKALLADDFVELPQGDGPGAWLDPDGELVAVGTRGDPLKVLRGFNSERTGVSGR
jgi:tRNA pseudouridine55 synthase